MEDRMMDSSGEPSLTLDEALKEIEELENVSTAVLGASDPSNCSYSKGYLKRQALYACLTCHPKAYPGSQPAGICLGCSYKCHDGHEMVELYTKRNFRCDCGNKKFSDNPCVLQKEKEDYNDLNSYNQNFVGLYCSCHRPYPDPEESEEDADLMVQCIICEDWHHTQHAIPGIIWGDYDGDEQGVELICGSCMPRVDFLGYYGSLQAKAVMDTEEPVVNVESDEGCSVTGGQDTGVATETDDKVVAENTVEDSSQDSGIASLNEDDLNKVTADKQNVCLRANQPKIDFEPGKGTIWSDGWRKKLCCCSDCKEMYTNLKVEFLMEEDDTIESYETIGKARADSVMMQAEESFNKQVNEMGLVGQIEFVSGLNNMKEALKDHLKDFATNGRVVEEKDILEFFETLRATKRPRLDGNFKY